MNTSDLDRYRTAWQGGQNFGKSPLGPDEIDAVLERQSRNVTRQLRTGLVMDIALKALCCLALAGLIFLFRDNAVIGWLNAAVLGFTLFLLFSQWTALKNIPGAELAGESLRDGLHRMIRFYREEFTRALYVAAVSGSLVFYIGILYYGWFKYGGMRPLDAEDYAVFITGLLLAFAINAIAQRWQAGFHLRELERCLEEIDAETLSEQELRQQRHRRVRITLSWVVWLVLGILVLTWFIAR